MAVKKIQIIPPENSYADVLHPETDDTMVLITDANGHFTGTKLDAVLDELYTLSSPSRGTGTIATTGWETVSGDYTKRYTFAITGVTATDVVSVAIDKDAHDVVQAADFCPTNESYAGGIYLYAKSIPASAIDFSYIVFK